MPLLYIGGSVAANVGGGLLAREMSREDNEAYKRAINEAFLMLQNVPLPDTEKMRLALESPQVQGIIQPYMRTAEEMGPTALESVSTDPRLRQAQLDALETLSKMGQEGLTAEDRMALNQVRRQVAADDQSRQQAILERMAQRGVGGSGMELAAKLSSSQSAADRAGQESDRLLAMAQRRMLEGVTQAGDLGGRIRSQDYGEQSDAARAKDAIAQFNLQQRASTQAANIGALNDAQLRNLMEQQRIHEVGIGTRNAQQQYNKELLQRHFENEMIKNQAMANARIGQAGMHRDQAQQTAAMWQGIGSSLGQGITGYGRMTGFGQKPQVNQAALDRGDVTNKGNPVGLERAFGQPTDDDLAFQLDNGRYRLPASNYNFDPRKMRS